MSFDRETVLIFTAIGLWTLALWRFVKWYSKLQRQRPSEPPNADSRRPSRLQAASQKRGSRLGPVTNLGDALPARRAERDWSTQEDCGERCETGRMISS
jgi:hypothetical protein